MIFKLNIDSRILDGEIPTISGNKLMKYEIKAPIESSFSISSSKLWNAISGQILAK